LPLTRANASEIWDRANQRIATPEFWPQALVAAVNVEVAVTTDDPLSDLAAHQQLEEARLPFKVAPSFRPDRALAPMSSPALTTVALPKDRLGRLAADTLQRLLEAPAGDAATLAGRHLELPASLVVRSSTDSVHR
jgi:glucuronate isomerase